MAEETEEVTEETEEHPEPKTVGHAVVQDNVSEPGVQQTHTLDEDGEVVTSTHGPEDTEQVSEAAAPEGEAEEPSGEVESESALVGSGPGTGGEDDGGDGSEE